MELGVSREDCDVGCDGHRGGGRGVEEIFRRGEWQGSEILSRRCPEHKVRVEKMDNRNITYVSGKPKESGRVTHNTSSRSPDHYHPRVPDHEGHDGPGGVVDGC